LYELARAGEHVEVAARRVRIDAFELLDFVAPEAFDEIPEGAPVSEARAPADASARAHPRLTARIACSKGTYIRSLAHDLGAALGPGAHLEALRRTRSGPFRLAEAIPPSALRSAADHLISPARALDALPAVKLPPALALAIAQGKPVAWTEIGMPAPGEGPVRLLDAEEELVAVAPRASAGERVRTLRVFQRDALTRALAESSKRSTPAGIEGIPRVSAHED
ncbi:MAG TPA: hypothetical protein VIU64_19740, partial [Polyangia bacterium]